MGGPGRYDCRVGTKNAVLRVLGGQGGKVLGVPGRSVCRVGTKKAVIRVLAVKAARRGKDVSGWQAIWRHNTDPAHINRHA